MDRKSAATSATQWSPIFIRLALGIPMVVSGFGKVLAVGPKSMGIPGFSGFLASLGVPLPTVAAWGVGLLELVGGLFLLVGLLVRVVGALVAVNMTVATVLAHLPNGYPASSGGVELTLALALVAVAVVLSGPGSFSLERALFDGELLADGANPATQAD
ncbi:DoxX family protein [Haloferax volcanii]|uniref:DoxX family membrane protein n=2 Tax=Haloferax volcanii TaxID=2246 RepID=A0A6C0UMM3_HALVO|nr:MULTISPECIES: DoxX family protein [Haloferax]NLV01111.1 DoxX family membrane protein [Haloferax alexandrinus]QIB76745.1 DoxX family protein [Haloferax alexandrinus]TVT86872.1 DoxX family protein [Haloferax volcanii]